MESVVSKIIYLFMLPKILVAFSAITVKTVFADFLKFLLNKEKFPN